MKRSVIVLFYICLFLLSITDVTAQNGRVFGNVTDSQNGNPVPGAHVFLSETTMGTVTDSLGNYEISNIPIGNYTLIASMVGFIRSSSSLVLTDQRPSRHYNLRLRPDMVQLEAIEIRSSNDDWLSALSIFKEHFIGSTQFGRQTEILNPEVLDLKFENGIITGRSEQPLLIENRALGYNLYIELDEFTFNPELKEGSYSVYTKFEEMESSNPETVRNWQSNRRLSYESSIRRFFLSVYQGTAQRDGFRFNRAHLLPLSEDEHREALSALRFVSEHRKEEARGFRITRDLQIEYGSEDIYVQEIDGEPSFLRPNKGGFIFIDGSGNLLDPHSIIVMGRWADQRIANLLPRDYQQD
jgi:hypothetical protein